MMMIRAPMSGVVLGAGAVPLQSLPGPYVTHTLISEFLGAIVAGRGISCMEIVVF